MTNPYASTKLSSDQQVDPYAYARVAFGMFAFAGTAFVLWILIIATFFRSSETAWPGWVSLIPACLCGIATFRISTRKGTPLLFALCIVSTCLLIAMLAIGYSFVPEGVRLNLVPDREIGFAPVHWLFIVFATSSVLSGVFAHSRSRRNLRIDARIIMIVSLLLSVAYLLWWTTGAYSAAAGRHNQAMHTEPPRVSTLHNATTTAAR